MNRLPSYVNLEARGIDIVSFIFLCICEVVVGLFVFIGKWCDMHITHFNDLGDVCV